MSNQQSWVEHRHSMPIAKRAVLDCAVLDCAVLDCAMLDCAMLESRTLFSASPLDPGLVLDSATQLDGESSFDELGAWDSSADVLTTDPGSSSPSLELVFVDAGVDDPQQLVDGLLDDTSLDRELRVFQLDGTRDGIRQMSDVLADFADLQAIHLVSHGSEGQIRFGNLWLHGDNLADYAADFANWNDALQDDADLLLYGCDVAANLQGQQLVDSLSSLCGCDVAASIDDTGHAGLGGDWQLEYSAGRIDTATPFTTSLQQGWQHLLALQTVRDEFTSASYSNSDGTAGWDGDWMETDLNAGGATGGNIRVASQQLHVEANDPGDFIYREVDLSAATTASLTFDFDNQLGPGGVVHFQVSSDGGSSWSDLRTYNNGSNGSGSEVVDLTPHRDADSQIRIFVNSESDGTFVRFDNVQIAFDANQPANAQDDTYVIDEDTSLVAASVLGNDIDPDGDPLTAIQVGPDPANAQSFTFNSDGTFTYTPLANFFGTDTFTYQANDGTTNSNAVTVSIVVNAVNDAPTLSSNPTDPDFVEGAGPVALFNSSAVDLIESGDQVREIQLTVGGLQNGVDEVLVIDGQAITLTDGNNVTTLANGLDVSVSVTGSTATVSITSATNYTNTVAQAVVDGLQYDNTSDEPQGASRTVDITLIADSGGTANGGDDDTTLSIASSVVFVTPGGNSRPLGTSDSYSVVGDTTLYVGGGGVLTNDTDADSGLLSAVLTNAPSGGSLVLNPDGSFSYTPALGFVGTDSFVYLAHDGLDSSDPVTVTITVEPPYIPPLTSDPPPGEPATDDDSDDAEAASEVIDGPPAREETRSQASQKKVLQREKHAGVTVITVLASDELDDSIVEPIVPELASASLLRLNEVDRDVPRLSTPRRTNVVLPSDTIWHSLDEMSEQMASEAERLNITIGSTASLTATVSVGYVVWLIRGGHIMAGVLAQLPAWHMVDPLPILAQLQSEDEDELDDSLASLVGSEDEPASDTADVAEVERPQDKWNSSQ